MKRPTSLSILAWFFIIAGAISVVDIPMELRNPVALEMMRHSLLPPSVSLSIGVISAVINIIVGIGVLKRRPWARTVYVAISLLGLVVTLISSPFKMMLIPSIVLIGLFLYILYRPAANAYFQRVDA